MSIYKQFLHACKTCNYIELKDIIYNDKIDININNSYGLKITSENGCTELVKLIITNNTNINSVDLALSYGVTYKQHANFIKFILETYEPSSEIIGKMFKTCCANNFLILIKIFIDSGCVISKNDLIESLQWAKENEHTQVIQCLYEYINN